MNAVIYYGVPVGSAQTVSEEVRSKGLNLLRSTPAMAQPIVTRKFTTVSYLSYVGQLGAAIKAAELNQWIRPEKTTYYYLSQRHTVPPFMRAPVVVWNYSSSKTPEEISRVRERFDALESVAKGKPALTAVLSVDRVKTLVEETDPNDITPSSTTSINISTYRAYIILHKLIDLVLRVHQYPLTDFGGNLYNYYLDSMQVEEKHMPTM